VTQGFVEGAPPLKSFTPILDTHTTAVAAYSLRKMDSDYTGSAIQIREDGGDTTQDIGFDANGNLDKDAIATFCGSNNGFVTKWYDQVGSNDAVQSTTTKQPKIYNGTTVITQGEDPAIEFDGTDDTLVSESTYTPADAMAQVLVATAASSETDQLIGDPSDRRKGMGLRVQSNNFRYYNGEAFQFSVVTRTATDNQNLHIWGRTSSGGNLYARLNTSEVTQSISLYSNSTTNIYLGARNDGSLPLDGFMQEYILFLDNQFSNASDIETNINDYYSIY